MRPDPRRDNANPRSARLQVRLRPGGRELLDRAAESAGALSTSEWARTVLEREARRQMRRDSFESAKLTTGEFNEP